MTVPTGEVAEHFEQQAKACEAMGSPFTAILCRTAIRVLDETTRTGRRVLHWPGDPRADALALRLCGALHALVLNGDDAALAAHYPPATPSAPTGFDDVFDTALRRHDAWIDDFLDNAPQTNETARAAALLPGFLTIARETGLPLALAEIGSSGGLNLFADRFHYRFGSDEWGDADYPVTLAPELRGAAPDLSGALEIAARNGCDVAPLDIHDAQHRLRLRAYLWPDQPERLARLEAALAVARAGDFAIAGMDAADFVRAQLAARQPGTCLVLFHSVVWQYLPDETKAAMIKAMETVGAAATAESPFAWLRLEGLGGSDPHATLQLTLWPGGETHLLARADFHVRWIEWLG